MSKIEINNFAQIKDVSLKLGDLTILVGAQGTGKSLALQWLKTAIDGRHIIKSLNDAGQVAKTKSEAVELIFGTGMGNAWGDKSSIKFDGSLVNPDTLKRRGTLAERAFFIPAHRSALISDGWAAPFQRLSAEMPVVARIFSQNLFDRFNSGDSDLFPVSKLLKQRYRSLIDDAIFHGGTVALETDSMSTKRLKLTHGKSKLPFMTWTAGQREFTPLLLGMYHLLPRTNKRKDQNIDWAIIEEPEMGLHPEAITVFLLLVMDLLWRGYKVVLSTHSPHVLTAVWMLQRLKTYHARWQLVSEAFGVPAGELRDVSEAALNKDYRAHFLSFGDDGKVTAQDISKLDPDAEMAGEADWGGLTRYSSRFGDAVRKAVNENERVGNA
ncbi:AAA family ATPase [Acidovorax sp. SUPP3334]|uniref:AAA family ATPase n=1 Tax=Acidovorax sp. SUPP3334 TaxID=2920881 RepID=UPI0023DE3FE2|nr:AAA family ATPase [Acidovorax sp. SUPP3334]GKT22650.1 AAA family ATPase [Acidovorax sp. SUPP3334]